MTPRQWLGAHEAGVPPALTERLRAAVVDHTNGAVSDQLATAGETLLDGVLAAGTMTRAHALDVLSADALLTYAFESAADEPARLAERADTAMRHIAALAEAR